jgi:hypothetical protein
MLEGPTAIAFIESSGDPAAVAKALAATAKETNVLTLRGGLLEGKTLSAPRSTGSRRCRRPTCSAAARRAIVAPLTQLLGARVGAAARPARLIDARIKQLEEQGEVVEPSRKRGRRDRRRGRGCDDEEPTDGARGERDEGPQRRNRREADTRPIRQSANRTPEETESNEQPEKEEEE